MPAITQFSFDNSVTAQDAKHDKLDLYVTYNTLQGTTDDIDAFRFYLGGCPPNICAAATGIFGRIFNRPESPSGVRKPLKVRRRSTVTEPLVPLFGGNLRFRTRASDPTGLETVSTSLRLYINPTRFLRYQDAENYIPPRRNFDSPDEELFYRPSTSTLEEYSLDGSDNWLPIEGNFARLHNSWLVARALRSYTEGVLRLINDDIRRAAASPVLDLAFIGSQNLRPFNVRSVESYFEFGSVNPLRVIDDLETLLRSYNQHGVSTTQYRIEGGEWRRNARVVTLNIRQPGTTLKVYAKTNHRLRFEVSHDLAKAKLRCEDGVSRKLRHTFANTDGVYGLLDRLRQDAADIVNDVLHHCRNQRSIPATDKTALDLLFDIAHTVGTSRNLHTIVSILCEKGSISSLPALSVPLRKLRRAGILSTQDRNSRQEHVVTERYKFALQTLRQNVIVPHLTTRNRTRGAS